MKRRVPYLVFVFCIIILSLPVFAQEAPPPGAADLAKQLSNPIASLISFPLQLNWEAGVGPEEDTRIIFNIQPVIPFSLNRDWNLVSRTILPIVSQPPLIAGGSTTFGFGDIVQSLFFSPNKTEPLIWGVGPAFLIPMSSDPFLGTEKFGLGPTAVVLKQSGPLTYGMLFNQIWSVAGAADRADVSQTFVQPFFAYGTKTGWTFTVNTESTANWKAAEDQKWTVPLNFVASKVMRIGRQPVSLGVGSGYYVEKPDGGPKWKMRFVMTFIFPNPPKPR